VNTDAERFWGESQGYSEATRAVLAQPGGVAYAIFDARIAEVAHQFEDFKQAEAVGAAKTAETLAELADKLGLPTALEATINDLPTDGKDSFGRTFNITLTPPIAVCASRVRCFTRKGGCAWIVRAG
jgi:fumarate reductase flavoprotein subunit